MSKSPEILADSTLLKEALEAVTKFAFTPLKGEVFAGTTNCFKITALSKLEKRVELFLKCVSEETPAREFDRQRWLTEQLFTCGYKLLPDIYKTADDSSLYVANGKGWICQSFIRSEVRYDWLNFDCSTRHCFQAGQTLASIHAAGAKLARKTLSLTGFKTSLGLLNGFAADFHTTSSRLEDRLSTDFADGSAYESFKRLNFGKLRRQAELLTADVLKLEAACTRQTVNHGDFHPGNVLFSSSGIQGVIDWDYARVGAGILDLCYALFIFTLNTPEKARADREIFSSEKTGSFLNGYNPSTQTVKNTQSLALYTEFVQFLMLNWVCYELNRKDSVYQANPAFARLAESLCLCLS